MSCDQLLLACTNRKKTDLINWYTFRKIKYVKEHPLKLFFETYEDIDTKYDDNLEQQRCYEKVLRTDKRSFDCATFGEIELPVLYPHGRIITTEKMKDQFITIHPAKISQILLRSQARRHNERSKYCNRRK